MSKASRLTDEILKVCPVYGVSVVSEGVVNVHYTESATPGDRAAAEAVISGFDWSDDAQAKHLAQLEKYAATTGIDDAFLRKGNRVERALVSAATSTAKAINKDRETLSAMNAAIQAATTLADLKSRMAQIIFPPQVTQPQVIAAIKADIAATPE